jgi:hypothetical protein
LSQSIPWGNSEAGKLPEPSFVFDESEQCKNRKERDIQDRKWR